MSFTEIVIGAAIDRARGGILRFWSFFFDGKMEKKPQRILRFGRNRRE